MRISATSKALYCIFEILEWLTGADALEAALRLLRVDNSEPRDALAFSATDAAAAPPRVPLRRVLTGASGVSGAAALLDARGIKIGLAKR